MCGNPGINYKNVFKMSISVRSFICIYDNYKHWKLNLKNEKKFLNEKALPCVNLFENTNLDFLSESLDY